MNLLSGWNVLIEETSSIAPNISCLLLHSTSCWPFRQAEEGGGGGGSRARAFGRYIRRRQADSSTPNSGVQRRHPSANGGALYLLQQTLEREWTLTRGGSSHIVVTISTCRQCTCEYSPSPPLFNVYRINGVCTAHIHHVLAVRLPRATYWKAHVYRISSVKND